MQLGVAQQARTTREQQAATAARELIVFADGLEQGGWGDYARRARLVARDALWALDELAAERSARQAVQQARDRLMDMLPVSSRSAGGQGAIRDKTASPAPLAVSGTNGKIRAVTDHRRRPTS